MPQAIVATQYVMYVTMLSIWKMKNTIVANPMVLSGDVVLSLFATLHGVKKLGPDLSQNAPFVVKNGVITVPTPVVYVIPMCVEATVNLITNACTKNAIDAKRL